MEILVRRSDLARELHLVQGIVERKNSIPILSNVLAEARSGELRGLKRWGSRLLGPAFWRAVARASRGRLAPRRAHGTAGDYAGREAEQDDEPDRDVQEEEHDRGVRAQQAVDAEAGPGDAAPGTRRARGGRSHRCAHSRLTSRCPRDVRRR